MFSLASHFPILCSYKWYCNEIPAHSFVPLCKFFSRMYPHIPVTLYHTVLFTSLESPLPKLHTVICYTICAHAEASWESFHHCSSEPRKWQVQEYRSWLNNEEWIGFCFPLAHKLGFLPQTQSSHPTIKAHKMSILRSLSSWSLSLKWDAQDWGFLIQRFGGFLMDLDTQAIMMRTQAPAMFLQIQRHSSSLVFFPPFHDQNYLPFYFEGNFTKLVTGEKKKSFPVSSQVQ